MSHETVTTVGVGVLMRMGFTRPLLVPKKKISSPKLEILQNDSYTEKNGMEKIE